MMSRSLEWFMDVVARIGFPTIWAYHAFVGNVFLNIAAEDAVGLEKWGDTLLSPFQYVFGGKVARPLFPNEQGLQWQFTQRFDYRSEFVPRLVMSVLALPESLTLGSFVKGIAYFGSPYRHRFASIQESASSHAVILNQDIYEKIGMRGSKKIETLVSQGYARKAGDELYLQEEKEAFQEITKLLNDAGIVWWVDCGTLLGVYRYGGVIPWDLDIDIAVLLPDFENVYRVLQGLDSQKYEVQDWSGRENPKSYLKVCLKQSRTLIDIYHFAIDEERRQLRYILSLENNIFLPESWRIREKRFTTPVSWDHVFPLKKGVLDGIEVFVPQNTHVYLQRYYGEDLSPAKLWNQESGSYEKDLSHPYWQRVHAH